MLEADGWDDGNAFPREAFENAARSTIRCLEEENYRQETGLEDTPTHLPR